MIETLLHKMLIEQNQQLTFEQVYNLFYTQFAHIRYIDDKHDLYNSLKCLHLRGNQYLDIILANEKVIRADKNVDSFLLIGESIVLNNTHTFKVYNKPLNNVELIKLLTQNA